MVRRYYVWRVAGCLLPVALLLVASVVRAQGQGGEAASAPAVSDAFNAADNAWMLTASSLVLMMTAPALALFYCGLVRKKNVLSVMMQCIFLMCLMTVLWVVYGYSLVFGGDGPIAFFGTNYLFLHGAEPTWTSNGPALPLFPGTSIPALTHMLFQGMFFIITPALMCGAFAERMKFSALVVLMVLWNTLIYCPLAHMVWGNGVLAYGPHAAPWAMGGCLDFAGGTVIHVSSGVSALVCALLLGKRLGYGSEPMPPHNMTYTAIGAAMLWFGWFGFNAGSALTAGRLATCAFTATHLAAGAGGLAWVALEWRSRGKPSVLGVCSGLVGRAGLCHPGSRLCDADGGAGVWSGGRLDLLSCLHVGQSPLRLRRLARRLRRPRRRRHARCGAHRHLCHAGYGRLRRRRPADRPARRGPPPLRATRGAGDCLGDGPGGHVRPAQAGRRSDRRARFPDGGGAGP